MEPKKQQALAKRTGMNSQKEFLAEYDPRMALTKLNKIRTLPDIFKHKTPSLARLRKAFDEDFVVDYLQLWIIRMNDIVGCTNKMNDEQVAYTAQLIYNEFPVLTISDIKYVFDGIVSGRYGELYNTIDSTKVCTWFRKHWDHRMNEAEQQAYLDHISNKPREDTGRHKDPRQIHKLWKKLK